MNLRDYIGAIARAGAEKDRQAAFRRLLVGAAKVARTSPAHLMKNLAGMGAYVDREQAEISTWIEADEIDKADGPRGFDVCDLRIWLELAGRAGVDAIPAREVARLTEDELEAILGVISIPDNLRKTLNEAVIEGAETVSEDNDAQIRSCLDFIFGERSGPSDAAEVFNRIEGALDDIPSSWMVRTQFSGSNNLKALVGTGLMQKADDTARVSPDFEIGGGWVRRGNRRIIDFSDPRFLELAIGGHKPEFSYLARPWVKPARFHQGEDLHRANSPLAGPGIWPSEWRVFVKNGKVTGVANYYGWTGDGATPENAWHAIEAAALGQRIADTATDLGLSGKYMHHVNIWRSNSSHPEVERFKSEWPEDGLHCTLDFLEGEDGMVFLEGGPGHMLNGGGHPCAFAGQGVKEGAIQRVADCSGVAYKNMPHVHLAEPTTWIDGDPEGSIDTWEDAARRALEHQPFTGLQADFILRLGVLPDMETDPGCEP